MDASRLVGRVLRCYPAHWRRRHGDEAAELAALLIRDGASAGSIAWSYLAGAARAWVTPHPGRRLSTLACALLVAACSLGVSAGLLASTSPARAASTSQAPGHIGCRPGAAGPGPDVVPASYQPPAIIWKAGHDGPC
jgi:hypothetical protein